MFSLVKSWDNRKEAKSKRLSTVNGRSWTRRVQWLEDASDLVKLKFCDGEGYLETGVYRPFAQLVWDRFKSGQSAQEAISVFGGKVTLSRKAVENILCSKN